MRQLAWLKVHCPCCKTRFCPGECQKGIVCYHCGDNHLGKDCRYHARKEQQNGKWVTIYKTNKGKALDAFVTNRGVCRWCLGKLKNGEKHGPVPGRRTTETQCTLEKRLRCAIFMERRKSGKSFGEFIRSIHGSDDAYHLFLAGLRLDT